MTPSALARTVRFQIGMGRETFLVSRALRAAGARATTAREIVDDVFRISVGATDVRPGQIPSEIAELVEIIRAERPRRTLEVGTAGGGTLFLLAWASADDARLLSLDINPFHRPRRRLYRSFGRRGQTVEILCADSHLLETRSAVAAFFGGEPLDVLFIDGDHSDASVRRDFELYAPLVRPGGIVAFHDIVGGREEVGGVPAFWQEVSSSLEGPREIVASADQAGYGIGLGRAR